MSQTLPDVSALVASVVNAIVGIIDGVATAISQNAQVIGSALVAFGILAFMVSQLRGMPFFGWIRRVLPI
ncbi:MAG: hypothetical protein QW512_05320 [Thermofilaceae archaeon]